MSRQDPVQNSAQDPDEGQGGDPGEGAAAEAPAATGVSHPAPGHAHGQGHAQPSSSRGLDPRHPGPGHPDQGHPGSARPAGHGAEVTHAGPAHAAGRGTQITHPDAGPGHAPGHGTQHREAEPGDSNAPGAPDSPDESGESNAAQEPRSDKDSGTASPTTEAASEAAAVAAAAAAASAAEAAAPPPAALPFPAGTGVVPSPPGPRGEQQAEQGAPSRLGRVGRIGRAKAAATADRHDARHVAAALPWYGLDAGWQGTRALGALSTGPDGLVEFGTLRHGDPGATRPDARAQRRAVTVLTMARLGRRPLYKADGGSAGSVEAMTVSAAAALAGVGLVEDNWPWELEASVRQHWLDQQRELAYVLAESLGEEPWQQLTVPVGEDQQAFRYRESTYGWVMASARPDCFIAAYGRGVSAYSLAFVRVDPAFYS